jgi:hypothetical protein
MAEQHDDKMPQITFTQAERLHHAQRDFYQDAPTKWHVI